MQFRQLCLTALIPLSFISANAAATFVDYGSITFDDETGIAWLDVSLSVGQSFDDVEAQFREGASFDGFRHATKSEVGELFVKFDLPFGYDGPVLLQVGTFTTLFGNTVTTTSDVAGVFGLAAPATPGPAEVAFAFDRLTLGTSEVRFNGQIGVTLSDPDVGHWLVTDAYLAPVPLPAPLVLFFSSVCAIRHFARKACGDSLN